VVLLLVKLGADVKSPYRNWTPLQRAAFLIDPEIVNILMANGAYVLNNTNSEDNDPDSEGERYRPLEERPSPLHYAVACGNHSTAKALIEGGINIDVRNIQKMTPLLAACEMAPQGNAKGPESIRFITAKMLISYGADICATNGQGSNALHLAVEARPLDVHTIRFLLQSGVNVNAKDSQDSTPFHVFCGGSIAGFGTKAETEEVFELLLAHAPPGIVNMERQGGSILDSDTRLETPLAIALAAENWPVFHLLLAKGAILRTGQSLDDILRKSAWYWALQPKAVNMLLKHGANPTIKMYGHSPLGHEALEGLFHQKSISASPFEDFRSILGMYIDHGLEVNATNYKSQTLLHMAIMRVEDNYESALTVHLLNAGVDPYRPLCGPWDAFLLAAIYNRLSALRLLIGHAAKKRNPDHWLRLPERIPTRDEDIFEIVYTSLCHAKLLDSPDQEGYTALQRAVKVRKTSASSALLSHSANLHCTDQNGWRLLHTATINGDFPTVALLLSAGADPNSTTFQWRADRWIRPTGLAGGQSWTGTPLHLAAMLGEPAIASLPISHGADLHASTGWSSPGHGPTALHIALDTGKFYGDRINLGKAMLELAQILVEHGASVENVASHLGLKDVCKFEGFEELWERLRVGIKDGQMVTLVRRKRLK